MVFKFYHTYHKLIVYKSTFIMEINVTFSPPTMHNGIPNTHMDAPIILDRSKQKFESKSTTELDEIIKKPSEDPSTSSFVNDNSVIISCKNSGCKKLLDPHRLRSENPWHLWKTCFLIIVIIALFIWIIVYSLLSNYEII